EDESTRAVQEGGIFVSGWEGAVDAGAQSEGQTIEGARLAMEGDVLHVKTGPAIAYWNPENTATGDYTVSATFTEPEYMNINDHQHRYGIFIGGSELGTDQQKYLYCAAYGNGSFIVRGFGPEPFQMNGRRPQAHDAVNQAAGQGEPVTQEIALSVRGDEVACT